MSITEKQLADARKIWGDALIAISKAFDADGIDRARAIAEHVIDTAYGYDLGPVLFKPTLSGGNQTFRTNRQGAISYFVGHNDHYSQDAGFGIKGWRKVTSETAASFTEGDVAMWMGWMVMTDKDNQVTKVDKSFGYKKDETGVLRIVLHHSSLPYAP